MDLYRQAQFPDNTQFLMVDQLIHGCINRQCKCKLMAKEKDVSVKDCLQVMCELTAVQVTMKKFERTTEAQVKTSGT